jgi:hypothetical protein
MGACLWGFALGGAIPGSVQAQAEAPPLRLEINAQDGGVRAILGPVLAARGIRSSLESGLPVRIRVVTQLWRQRIVDAQQGRHEWRASIWYDPFEDSYRVELEGGTSLTASSTAEAVDLLAARLQVPLRPPRPGRYYYLARIEVETLSLSDLDELRRWLQGDLAPAVEGDRGVGSAVGRGFGRLLVRILGLPTDRFQARSPTFDYPGDAPGDSPDDYPGDAPGESPE